MYYIVIKHDGHLRTPAGNIENTLEKHRPQASVFYISRVFSNARQVFYPDSLIHGLEFFICFMI